MNQIYTPGQEVHLLYWKRPEETEFTRVSIYQTQRGLENAKIQLMMFGLITLPTISWNIPLPVEAARN